MIDDEMDYSRYIFSSRTKSALLIGSSSSERSEDRPDDDIAAWRAQFRTACLRHRHTDRTIEPDHSYETVLGSVGFYAIPEL